MIELNQNNIKEIANYINKGYIIALPTETVYGLAVSYHNTTAINKLKDFKERENKPFAIMLSDIKDINNYAFINSLAEKIIASYLPGELTIVLEKKSTVDNIITNEMTTIGIRVPDNQFLANLISITGPLVVTSANKKGENPCLNSDEVKEQLKSIDVVVTGKSISNIPTTVVSIVNNQINVLREGKYKIEDFK